MTSINPLNQTKLNNMNFDNLDETDDIETEENEETQELFYTNSDSDSDSEYGTYEDMSSSNNPLDILRNLINAKDNLGTAKDNIDTMDTNTEAISAKAPEIQKDLEKEGNAAITLIANNNKKVEKLSTKQNATAEEIKSAQEAIESESGETKSSGSGNPFAPPTAETFDGTGAGKDSAFSLSLGGETKQTNNNTSKDDKDKNLLSTDDGLTTQEGENSEANTPITTSEDENKEEKTENSTVNDAQSKIEIKTKEFKEINQDIKTTEKSSKTKANTIELKTNKAKEETDANTATTGEAAVETNAIDTVTEASSTAATVGMAVGATTSIWNPGVGGAITANSAIVSGLSTGVDFGNEAAKGNITTAKDAITGTAGVISTVAGGVDKIVNKEEKPPKQNTEEQTKKK